MPMCWASHYRYVMMVTLQNYEITGVFIDYPANSHLDIKYLVSYDAFKKIVARDWQ